MRSDALRPRLPATALVGAILAALLLSGLTTDVAAGATTMTPRCDYASLRTGPSTTYAKKASIRLGTTVTVVATVSGGSYGTTCVTMVYGSSWYRISAVNGRSVMSLYGVTYVYGASKVYKAVLAPTPTPSPTVAPAASASPTAAPPIAPTAPSAPPSSAPSADPSSSPSAAPSVTPSPSPSTSPLPDGVTPLGDTIQFFGRGWGHGVGLSQYGAYGRASAGQSAATILAHYYTGTTLGTVANANVRVLVLSGFSGTTSNPLRIYGRLGSWTIDGVSATFPVDAQLKVTRDLTTTTGWRIAVTAANGTTLYNAGAPSSSFYVRPGSGAVLQLYSKPSYYDHYRGTLRVIATSSATLNVVNTVPLETYLRGAVPAEMPASWPGEALKSQAIAARTYAAYRLHPTSGTWDVYDDTRSQVYRGYLAEKSSTNSAIGATAGKVVRTSTGYLADTLYHSSDGGWTENSENVFVSPTGAVTSGKVSYLRGVSDRAPDGSSYDKASPYAAWHTASYTLAQIQAVFAGDSRTNVGTLIGLDLRNRGVSGRLISVTLYGANGTTKKVSGGVFIAVFNSETGADPVMRNTLFNLSPIP
ncbi:MAG TPA: SpoIID/LytB domain-containing protein [Candidatus Limnocylindrales bacterium]|nr:SpoIID/LytB domain-containing protein [Candidatus Limnocylindrales bacterium]